ncbi:hypothetical protein ACJX0J_023654, partial [Zea mays]
YIFWKWKYHFGLLHFHAASKLIWKPNLHRSIFNDPLYMMALINLYGLALFFASILYLVARFGYTKENWHFAGDILNFATTKLCISFIKLGCKLYIFAHITYTRIFFNNIHLNKILDTLLL